MNMNIFLGLILPLIGTSAGAACVFVMRRQMNALVQKALLGFASGVMVAASVWSLLIPAMEMSSALGRLSFLPAVCGLIGGIVCCCWTGSSRICTLAAMRQKGIAAACRGRR